MTILDTDILSFGTDGFDYTVSNESVTVNPGVTIASNFEGIKSTKSNSSLLNKGNIIGGDEGVFFNVGSDNSTVTNALGALIVGHIDGVEMRGQGTQIFNNFGKDIATNLYSVHIDATAATAAVNNHGQLLSGDYAVGFDAPGSINNFGVMKGANDAIHIDTLSPNIVVTINNRPGGVIKGGFDAIYSQEGAFNLNNFGKIVGFVVNNDPAGPNDVWRNHGVIQGEVILGTGNEFFRNFGNARSGPIFGGTGNDTIIGGNHNDQIHSGFGHDVLAGGKGADTFVFGTTLNAVANVATINDFSPTQHDKIDLSHSIFTGLLLGPLDANHFAVGAATNSNPQIDYDPTTGALVYAPNGNAGGSTEFAILANHAHISLHESDLVVIA
jgi:Ca2+-binding RTX toxin-like protein